MNLSKILILLGSTLVLLGAVMRIPGIDRLGRLPGDVRIEGKGFGFYFPWVSGLVVSLFLSLLFYLLGRGRG
jgi:hypothetical protein